MKNSIVTFLVFTIINFPKIDLIALPGMAQGVRLDDVIVVFLFSLALFSPRKRYIPSILLIVFGYLVSTTALSMIIHPGADIVRFAYIVRVLEYGVFAYALYHLRCHFDVEKVCVYTTIFQFLIVFLQLFMGKDRPSGTFNGPWELVTVVGVLLLSYSFFSQKVSGKSSSYYVFIISVLTKSRSATLGILFTIISFDKNVRKYLPIFILLLPPLFYVFARYSEVEWLETVFRLDNFNLLVQFFNYAVQDSQFSMGETLYNDYSELGDASLAMRLGIWLNLINLFSQSEWTIFKYFLGIGLGSNGIVIDGFYIRLIFELGIVGIIIYTWIMLKIWRIKKLRRLVVFLFFTCLTLDPYTSSKVSYTLGAIYAAYKRKTQV